MKQLYRIVWFLTVAVPLFVSPAQGQGKGLSKAAKEKIEQRYRAPKRSTWSAKLEDPGNILVLLRDGIPAARGTTLFRGPSTSGEVDVDIKPDGTFEPPMFYDVKLEIGMLLRLFWTPRIKNDRIELWCETVNEYDIRYEQTRRTGLGGALGPIGAATADTVIRRNYYVKLRFFFNETTIANDDLKTIFSVMDQWVKPFDSKEAALTFLETKPFTREAREIQLGMTIAEVEVVFGPPETKVSLGQKVIYKYKDMAIEFVDGKVADVKF